MFSESFEKESHRSVRTSKALTAIWILSPCMFLLSLKVTLHALNNVTTWSEHAKHYILTSDFDAALISETHLEREKLVTAAKEARKFSWAGTGSAAISTANNDTSAGVLALVRTRRFSAPTHVWQGGSSVSWVGRCCCLQLISSTPSVSAAIFTPVRCKTCVFSRDGKVPFILGADFNFLPSLRQDLSMHGVSLWIRKLGASVVIPEGTTHTCCIGKDQKN